MLDNNTAFKLHDMKLHSMAQAFQGQLQDASFNTISFEERFGLLVDTEWNTRKSNRLKYLIRAANYAITGASLEDIEYHADRKLDRAQIARLSTCNYISEGHNIIILGATGSGKSFISNAFGISANRSFYASKYVRAHDLLSELAIARDSGQYQRIANQYKSVKLLILDDWLLFQTKESEARDLLAIVDARHKKASTIFCSQFEVIDWHARIGEPTLAEAICDRIAHDSYTIMIGGNDSMRKRKGIVENHK